ncbi:MAG: hypothetical protein ACE5GX_05090 [Thermoanaerobaculia bacterium]
MSRKQDVARRFRLRRILEGSLALGGTFNLALGVLLGLAPDRALGLLQLPRPTEGFYLQLLATLAALLGCYYILASSDVRRYSGVIALAIGGRFIVGLAMALVAARHPELRGFGVLAGVELAFGMAHAASWWSIR